MCITEMIPDVELQRFCRTFTLKLRFSFLHLAEIFKTFQSALFNFNTDK